jgi:hypothetical protein
MVAVPPFKVSTCETTGTLTAGTEVVPPCEVTYETVPVGFADDETYGDDAMTFPDSVMTGDDQAGAGV